MPAVRVLVFSMPYALLVTSVLFGKHIDKIVPDTALGIRTLPVILGEPLARRTGQVLMIAFYPLLAGRGAGRLGRPVGAARGAGDPELSRALQLYNKPKPAAPPAWYPARGWPLWFVGFAFRHVRLAGFLLTLGLVLNVARPGEAAAALALAPG